MNLTTQARQHLKEIASETLDVISRVAEIASRQLRSPGLSAESFAVVNTLTSGRAQQNLNDVNAAHITSNGVLMREPVIARVVVIDESQNEQVYYICRATPVSGSPGLLASYKAPVGRLASLSIGDQYLLPNGNTVEVVERTRLRPQLQSDGWDSKNSIYEDVNQPSLTIESLRALLRKTPVQEAVRDLLSQILEEDSSATQIFEGTRRDRITKMGLRDQPILDKYQDEIFRLPLDERLLILGPPGTGKTTTLIRRLSQKLDIDAPESLSEGERLIIQATVRNGGVAHSDSWQMFTPTELLKQYLKEAFAREGVPASDFRLKTWMDYRRDLGRNALGILRSPGTGGYFTLKDHAHILAAEANDRPIAWFEDFDTWQRHAYLKDLHQGAKSLIQSEDKRAAQLGFQIEDLLGTANTANMPALFVELQTTAVELQALAAELKALTDQKIDDALNLALNRNDRFVEELGQFIDQLQLSSEPDTDSDEDTEAETEAEDEDPALPKTGRGPAIKAFRLALKAQARAEVAKRSLSKASRNAKVVEWLGERTLSDIDRSVVGPQLLLLAAERRLLNPVRRYLDGLPRRYRQFRREKQETGTWYSQEKFAATDISPLELDGVLLASLRCAGELLSRSQIAGRIDDAYWAALHSVRGLYKNQILVDEATDFSPIQLACMGALANPQLRSFFACGDFNQRLTTWGSRSIDEIRWVFPEIDIRYISITYRQSRQLNEFARSIIEVLGGDIQDASLPPHVNSDGESPALLEHATEDDSIDWLAKRVRTIAAYLKQLPSTAVFVNSEADVIPMADSLNLALEDDNIRVVACPRGQVMGNDNDVRVFDIQHIKGLEFEAVFFVSIDQLATMHPSLFSKYLYVGATRAAMYLGITCAESLPKAMEPLRIQFVSNW